MKNCEFEQTQSKYYRYIKYLVSQPNFKLPEGLESPREVLEMRLEGNFHPDTSKKLHQSYFDFINRFGFSKLEKDVAFSIMLSTYATSPPKVSMNELNEAIDQLDSYFPTTLNFDLFE